VVTAEQPDWVQLLEVAAPAKDELKAKLDLVLVATELGLLLEQKAEGRWHGLCPFHDDHRPSFSVYRREDGSQACGCFACDFGRGKDVFAFLMALRGYGFKEALVEAQALLRTAMASTVLPRSLMPKPLVDFSEFVAGATERARLLCRSRGAPEGALGEFLAVKGLQAPPTWLVDEFGLGVTPDGAGVVFPHFTADGEAVAAKVRRAVVDAERPWKPVAVRGSRLVELYGAERDRSHRHVLLVEGETDTLAAAWLTRDWEVDVFWLPSGAGAAPRWEWLDHLAGRVVTLCFDGDVAGRSAAKRWSGLLDGCYVAALDDGQDVVSSGPDRFCSALRVATYMKEE
jgi:DNA primase